MDRHRSKQRPRRLAVALLAAITTLLSGGAGAVEALEPDRRDLEFILEQIKRAEAHAEGGQLLGDDPLQISDPQLPYGLRTVNGEFNNLNPGRTRYGAADRVMPRLLDPVFRPGEELDLDGPAPGSAPPFPTSYEQTSGYVGDSAPRVISNLIVDQSPNNPAAVAAAGGAAPGPGGNLPIPNVAPDAGLSAPYNSWFTLFGQFFDHGLDLTTKGGSGTVLMPLKPDDPLYVPGGRTNFMVLTRATNQKGPDGELGTSDDVREHVNTTTPFVDQNQTYTSHPSHQVFLREFVMSGGRPVSNGRLLEAPAPREGIGTWADVKRQARELLGIALDDQDIRNVPLLKTDPYGRFLPDGAGLPQIVTGTSPVTLDSGTPDEPVDATRAVRTGHAFLDDIAHHAAPFGDHDRRPETPDRELTPDTDPGTTDDRNPATYDDELLDKHFITGDGRGNENIGLTAVHHVFHTEHNMRVEEIKELIEAPGGPAPAEWKLANGEWSGERLFQAARFVTEMQYQHLVFEEFARKIQPQVNVFSGYQDEIDPAIVAEFAHTVYRFGHSMLTETVARKNKNGTDNDVGLIQAFLNPEEFHDGGSAGQLSSRAAAGSIVRGMTRQVGNEIDEFVTGAVRSNLVGLPLDLAAINIARGRDAGVPGLNAARREFYNATVHAALKPYENWNDFKLGLRNEDSFVNFVAAYGTHPSIVEADTAVAKRAAATAIVAGTGDAPPDSADFLESQGDWANRDTGETRTGVDAVDFWIGGLAEKPMPFGGMLGSTFNYVFETQMEKLQNHDRFYYLSRTAGLHFLTQLEENSFAEMIMRTTDTTHLPFDVFSRPDFVFELDQLGTSGPVPDDPATPYDESTLLTRAANGTFRFAGEEHVVFGGTSGADRVRSSEGDDTLWGDGGADHLEGGAGNDAFIAGPGDDTLTDIFGDDNLKGGDGDDAINAGSGFDLILGGAGKDFVVAGADPKETFGGGGDDFIDGGDSADTVFGNEGDDWIEGGPEADLLQGENGDPFQQGRSGDDVISGEGGADDLDSEGGDDVMITGPGTDRNEGMFGFDFVTHRGDAQPADADLNFTGLLPPDKENLRDRFDNVEGLSGWRHDDILRGDDATAATMADHRLTNPDLITGLGDLLGGSAATFTGGNILLGGAGSDVIEGRGGNDVIDGDAWLDARVSIRSATDPAVEIGEAASMREAQARIFDGTLRPSQLRIERAIEIPAPAADAVDTAVFSDASDNYDIEPGVQRDRMTIVHARGTAVDGTDTVMNVERLQFADRTIEVEPLGANAPAGGTVSISDVTPTEDQSVTATQAVTDPDGVNQSSVAFDWQVETGPGVWASVGAGTSFTPGDGESGSRLRAVARFRDGDGVLESVASDPTAAVVNVNDGAGGQPGLSTTSPTVGGRVTALTGPISDPDGLTGVSFRFRWQQRSGGTWGDIPGATSASFTPTVDQRGCSLRVIVAFDDAQGGNESLMSSATTEVVDAPPLPLPAGDPPARRGDDTPGSPSGGGGDQVRDTPTAEAPPGRTAASRGALSAKRLRVARRLRSGTPMRLEVDVPEGATLARIRVFRLARAPHSAMRPRTPGSFIGTAYRATPHPGRHVFRLTGRRLRRLLPGRYLVEVRVGTGRKDLGPALVRTVTVTPATGRRP